MSGIAILLLCVGIFLLPVSFVFTAIRFFKLSEALMKRAHIPGSRLAMWLIGLVCIIAAFLV